MLTLMIVLVLTSSVNCQQNVIFQKVAEVSTTRSKWTVTFVIDLEPYQIFIKELFQDLYGARILARTMQIDEQSPQNEKHVTNLNKLEQEIIKMNISHSAVSDMFEEYKSLLSRSKRSVLPVVGKILGFLFGTVSESDLRAISENVNALAKNQQKIVHVLKESLTILNISRIEIAENRDAINELITVFGRIQQELYNVTRIFNERMLYIERHVVMNSIVSGLSRSVTQARFYIEHLQMQLNMMSLGHLSPSIISPKNLKAVLTAILKKLPTGMLLPNNPITDLWSYYQVLTCQTVMEENRIFVVMSLPLLDFNSNYEIFKPFNLPLPINDRNDKSVTMLAYSNLEAKAIGVNLKRSKYIILNDQEIDKCIHSIAHFCDVKSPIYRINLSKLCIVALFMKDKKSIKNNCQNVIQLNKITPMAEYLDDGMWIVVTYRKLRMTITCDNSLNNRVQMIKPPLGMIKLEIGCAANNDELTLMPFYDMKTNIQFDTSFSACVSSKL